jgi:hypothetical protein
MRPGKVSLAALISLLWLAGGAPAAASEAVGNIAVFSAEETAAFATRQGGVTYLDFPGARRWQLMEGADIWFPMALDEVVAAVSEIDFPVSDLYIDVVILHVPRVNLVESSAEGSVVFLTPGRVAYPVEHIHYTAVHEIGHAVQAALMPDSRRDLWLEYAGLRGFDPDGGPGLPHAWRPHEIFAEDFRALFGGERACFGGRVENHDLAPPDEVEGLREFFLSLPGRAGPAGPVSVGPNPSLAQVVIKAAAGEAALPLREVMVLDIRGRLVRELGGAGETEVTWDGLDSSGRSVAPGAYVITGRAGTAPFARKIIRLGP